MSQQEDDDAREIDQKFLLDRLIPRSWVDKTLFVLQKNGIMNVGTLLNFPSEDRLRNLKAKNDKGEEVTLVEGTVLNLWAYIERMRGSGVRAQGSFLSFLRKMLKKEKQKHSLS